MRVLVLTRYDTDGSSSRVRFYQYIPYLSSHGVECQIEPLLYKEYVADLYAGKRPSALSILQSYWHRIALLAKSGSFDLLWIEKELFPWLSPWGENWLRMSKIPYVVDYDDAIFHRYDLHQNRLIRTFLGSSIDTVMRQATTVVTGNDYLEARARSAGARHVEYLPSVVDTSRYNICPTPSEQFRIGWIGSPVTAPFLGTIQEALEVVVQKTNAILILVGAGDRDPLPNLPKMVFPWSDATEIESIQTFDVGIMPLSDGPFEQGKCGYKLIQYMACGLPVVASPVGINARIVENGENGYLASRKEEWVTALLTLGADPALRSNLGRAGREKVEREYSLHVAAPQLLRILQEACGETRN